MRRRDVVIIGIFVGFEMLYNGPERERAIAEQRAAQAQQEQVETGATQGSAADSADAPAANGPVEREQVLAASAGARVVIDTPNVDGSISLQGARIDDLNLRDYRRTVDDTSPEVTVLAPMSSRYGHDAFFGWELQSGPDTATLADAFSAWTAEEGARLTPETPVTLTLEDNGLRIARTIAIDADYMFTITDVITNTRGEAVQLRPFGTVRRDGMPQDYVRNQIVHQGLVGVFGERNLRQFTYENAQKHARDRVRGRVGEEERLEEEQAQGGWLGLTDHYWLTAIIPDQSERMSAYFDSRTEDASTDFRAAYRGQWREAAAGGSVT